MHTQTHGYTDTWTHTQTYRHTDTHLELHTPAQTARFEQAQPEFSLQPLRTQAPGSPKNPLSRWGTWSQGLTHAGVLSGFASTRDIMFPLVLQENEPRKGEVRCSSLTQLIWVGQQKPRWAALPGGFGVSSLSLRCPPGWKGSHGPVAHGRIWLSSSPSDPNARAISPNEAIGWSRSRRASRRRVSTR